MKLTVHNVTAGYGNREILHGINMSIDTEEVLCLLGPNGSGKTTLFKAILGLVSSQGSICIDNKNISEFTRQEKAKLLAYIPQIHTPPFPFTSFDVVLTGRTPFFGMFDQPSKEDREKAYDAFETLKITHLAHCRYTQLSGGERQMVLIARALAQSPKFLIMDEPTSYLDFGNQLRILQTIRDLAKKEMGIILITHVPDHAFMCASRVLALLNGKMIADGEPEIVLTSNILNRLYNVNVDIINLSKGGCMCAPAEGVLV